MSSKDTYEIEQSDNYHKRKGAFCDDESSHSRNLLSVGEKNPKETIVTQKMRLLAIINQAKLFLKKKRI